MKGIEELEKTDEQRRKEVLLRNQKRFHAIVTLLGDMDETWELIQHLNPNDELFDPDQGCDVISCRHCGACGSNVGMKWKEIRDSDGKQISKMDDENQLFCWEISCLMCGETWVDYLHKVE